jgi:hypothetical protein
MITAPNGGKVPMIADDRPDIPDMLWGGLVGGGCGPGEMSLCHPSSAIEGWQSDTSARHS